MKMNLKSNDVKKVFDILNSSRNICIAGHKAPDGDCIGSVMALYSILEPMGKNLTVCIDGNIPYNYKPFVDESVLCAEYSGEKFDAAVVLDCSDAQRLGRFGEITENSGIVICIDHHKTNDNFADINIIDPKISSTGELLYNIIRSSGIEISKKAAEYIYMAILTDTGKFSYSSTTGDTHRVAADLIEKGVDVAYMDNVIYSSKPSNIVKAFIDCIKSIELHVDNKLGIAVISQKILRDNDVEMGDIDGVVEFIREIREVEVSCVLKEYGDSITKVSLRSKNDVDVSQISLKFGGGGHQKAAGFEVEDSPENTKKIIIDELRKHLAR